MALDLATLGKRLKEARTNSGITQEQAAEALGVPRTAITQLEQGNRSISTLELAELAKLYGRPVHIFFQDEDHDAVDPLVALLRAGDLDGEAVQNEIRRWVGICREGVSLENLLDRRPRVGPPDYELRTPRSYGEAVEQGSEIADEERNRLGIGNGPIPDMADLASCQGVWATGARLLDEISGLFLHDGNLGMVILVNFGHARGRKRFSYAHEYAHCLFDRKCTFTVTAKKNSNELVEKRANSFAASFLVPKAGLEQCLWSMKKGGASRHRFHVYDVATELGIEADRRESMRYQDLTFQDVALLAVHFGVSYQVIAYRLADLGFVNRQELDSLLAKLPAAHTYLNLVGRLDEIAKSSEGDKELRAQIIPLMIEAFRRGAITRARLLDLSKKLEITGTELAKVAEEAKQ